MISAPEVYGHPSYFRCLTLRLEGQLSLLPLLLKGPWHLTPHLCKPHWLHHFPLASPSTSSSKGRPGHHARPSLSHMCISRLSTLTSEDLSLHLLLSTSSAMPLGQACFIAHQENGGSVLCPPRGLSSPPSVQQVGPFPSKGLSMSLPSAEPREASPTFSTWLYWPSRSVLAILRRFSAIVLHLGSSSIRSIRCGQ